MGSPIIPPKTIEINGETFSLERAEGLWKRIDSGPATWIAGKTYNLNGRNGACASKDQILLLAYAISFDRTILDELEKLANTIRNELT